jgi:hypothetical protein
MTTMRKGRNKTSDAWILAGVYVLGATLTVLGFWKAAELIFAAFGG